MIARAPDRPPARSPSDPRYFDERDLEGELRRTFHICHECRMCVTYCGSFPELFRRIDRDVDEGRAESVEMINADDIATVVDECWQCKLCYVKCPYTAHDGAPELLDFPRLMAREKAVRARRNGVALVDQILGEPHAVGAMGSGAVAPLSNLISKNRLLRKVQEKVTGVSSEFPLPPFAGQTFPAWMKRRQPAERAGEAGEVVLFATCYGNFNTPEVPRAAVRVLEHAGYAVRCVEETCCGMPNLDGGDVDRFCDKVRANVARLLPHVREGARVLVAQPTCAYTLKHEWKEYVEDPAVAEVAAATVDLMEFLEGLRKDGRLPLDFATGLGQVAYHASCHLRAQRIGLPAVRLLGRAVPDTDVEILEECSAVDGTWGIKAAHYETGRHYAQKLVKAVAGASPDLVVSDCGLSALRIAKENGVPVVHPVVALARAYGLEEP